MKTTGQVVERAENERNYNYTIEERIRDIRRRIEEQKSRIAYNSTSGQLSRSESSQPHKQSMAATPTRESKESEMNALKAKLMGKK